MEITGQLTGVTNDIISRKTTIHIEVDELRNADDIRKLIGKRIRAILTLFRKKRSHDANKLFWACLGELAAALKTDTWSLYLLMLRRYGQFTYICVRPEAVEMTQKQWRETEVVGEININGEKAIQMLCYFGSSSYDTKGFSRLLDGVISEMKEQGLSLPLPEDVKAALEDYEKHYSK